MPPISPDQEFHFGFDPEAPITESLGLGDSVIIPDHKRILEQFGKIRTEPCSSNLGKVIALSEPLDAHGRSYVGKALCISSDCGFVATIGI